MYTSLMEVFFLIYMPRLQEKSQQSRLWKRTTLLRAGTQFNVYTSLLEVSFQIYMPLLQKHHSKADREKKLPYCMRAPNFICIRLVWRSLFTYICLVCRNITEKQIVKKNYLVACGHPISYVYDSSGGLFSYIYASFAETSQQSRS